MNSRKSFRTNAGGNSRSTNIRAGSNSAASCRRPRRERFSASSCARRRNGGEAAVNRRAEAAATLGGGGGGGAQVPVPAKSALADFAFCVRGKSEERRVGLLAALASRGGRPRSVKTPASPAPLSARWQ